MRIQSPHKLNLELCIDNHHNNNHHNNNSSNSGSISINRSSDPIINANDIMIMNDDPGCVVAGGANIIQLSTDPKPRLRWTSDLHKRFADAVAQLGGPDSTSAL